MTGPVPVGAIALGLNCAQALSLYRDPALHGALVQLNPAFIVVGLDRASEALPPARTGLEPTIAAAYLSRILVGVPVLSVGTVQRDHPYNIARRIASLDHITRGRSGLILAERDRAQEQDPKDLVPGASGAGLSGTVPLRPETTADALLAVRRLWQTWPRESIIAHREDLRFVQRDRIRSAGHSGVFHSAGPLSVPTTEQGTPVAGWYVRSREELEYAVAGSELIALAAGAAEHRSALDNHRAASANHPPVFQELILPPGIGTGDAVRRIRAETTGQQGDGLLVAISGELSQLVQDVLPGLLHAGAHPQAGSAPGFRGKGSGTLRSRLGIAPAPDLLSGAGPAFGE